MGGSALGSVEGRRLLSVLGRLASPYTYLPSRPMLRLWRWIMTHSCGPNALQSVRAFARSCMTYSLGKGWDLFLSTKNTILKVSYPVQPQPRLEGTGTLLRDPLVLCSGKRDDSRSVPDPPSLSCAHDRGEGMGDARGQW